MIAPLRNPSTLGLLLAAGCFGLLPAAAGCGPSAPAASVSKSATARPRLTNVKEVLEQMVEAYHNAQTYQDNGLLLVHYEHDGEFVDETHDFSLAVTGPNKLRMRAYQTLVVCDGRNLRATIPEAPGEVFSVAAPEELSLITVYDDRVLLQSLNRIVGSISLALFLDPAPLQQFLLPELPPQLMAMRQIDGANCYRVWIKRPGGAYVLWIDEQTLVLRRVEYPTAGYRQSLEQYLGRVTGLTITAELQGARLDAPIADATYRFELPRGAELVKQFDAVRVGVRIPRFTLRSLDGTSITRQSLEGKIAVLKFWQTDDDNSLGDLAQLQQVYDRYQDSGSIVFLAVSVDPADTSDDDLRSSFAKAGLSLPMARASLQVAIRSFGLEAVVPVTVVLGRDGRLQEHVVGVYPDQAARLPKTLDKLLSGGDMIAEGPRQTAEPLRYLGYVLQPRRKFAEVRRFAPDAAFPDAVVAPKSEPEQLRLKRLWTCAQVQVPGNIVVVPRDSAGDRVIVLDGWQSVAEIGAGGKLSQSQRLDLPDRDDAVITFLRTATDGEGKRFFLGSTPGVQQLHLFDHRWGRLLSFPDSPEHPGISDALLADLEGDGQLEICVGYGDVVGIHCVALDGRRLWRNYAADNILALALTGPDLNRHRRLLATSLHGTVLPIEATGDARPPIALVGRFARLIFTADLDGDGESEYCAIANDILEPGEFGPDVAVGVSPRGEELWNYELPAGKHPHREFEPVTAGTLLGGETGQWVVAGADGSIHILDIDGALIDHFNYGASLGGLAVANIEGRGSLIVATDDGVEAWQFDEP